MAEQEEGPQKQNVIVRFQRFLHNSKRIFKISHKPTKKEYWLMCKICIVGFLILGVLAFIIHQIIVVVDPLNPQNPSSAAAALILLLRTISLL